MSHFTVPYPAVHPADPVELSSLDFFNSLGGRINDRARKI
jgi:hypothetical protein